MVASQVSLGPPTEGSWLHSGKNSRGRSQSRVKADLFREIHTPQTVWSVLEGEREALGYGVVSFYGLGNFIC